MSEGTRSAAARARRAASNLEVGRVVHAGGGLPVSIVIFGSKQGVGVWTCRSNQRDCFVVGKIKGGENKRF
jgi:hypothetical protein